MMLPPPALQGDAAAQGGRATPDLSAENVSKRFGEFVALDEVSLKVARGEFVAIMGPSGCGKTTLLRIIAGLETFDRGAILLRGRSVDGLPVHKRGTRLVWQSYALFPHLDVRRNIAFGLTLRRHDRRAVHAKVAEVAAMLRLEGLLERRIADLSGGQKQRVAIARALATDPELLLLDEPLSALDAHLRVRVQGELKRLQQSLGISFVYVTHNQSEAFSMADRVVVMDHGRIEQTGTPEAVYTRPATRFVAEFVGMNNLMDGRVLAVEPDRVTVGCACGPVTASLAAHPELRGRLRPGDAVTLVVQAGKVARIPPAGPSNRIRAVLAEREFVGSQVVYHLRTPEGGGVKMVVQEPFGSLAAEPGATLDLHWAAADTVVLPAADAGSPAPAPTVTARTLEGVAA